jgi:glycosyltransferase involved in cell wall biosynthesis
MDKFLVSIIIPTYNRPDLLKNAIRSALNQIYKEIEIIVVDDASTANNQSVIDSFDFEIKYHRFETNQGGNICRNKGVELSNGKYIAFLDDDDVWLQTKLEQQLILMQENDIDLSYTGKNIITVDENLKEKNRRYSFAKPKFTSLKKSIMYKNFIGTTSSIMIKKDKFLEVGGFDVKMPSLQDYEFYLRFIHDSFHDLKLLLSLLHP